MPTAAMKRTPTSAAYAARRHRTIPRIVYRKLDHNLGISGNTNCAIEMSIGSYLGLLDHDDILHPAALYEVMCAICERNADMIYTDEATFSAAPPKGIQPKF